MKRQFLTAVILAIVAILLFVASIDKAVSDNSVEQQKYINMVNSTVLIYDDIGHGSGVFIEDNVILTAAHVVNHPDLSVELIDGTILKVEDVYMDGDVDVGFIFIDANEINTAQILDIPVNIGDPVYLVGTPYHKDYKFTLMKGIVSHLNRAFSLFRSSTLLQVNTDGGPGFSGGPLYNEEGRLVGMYVGQSGRGGVGISFCESSKSILEAYERCMIARDNG